MGQFEGYHLAVAIIDLIGSLSSFCGASFIAICYFVLPIRRHFRHSLILNLAIADLLNGLNNATSGIYILSRRKDLTSGAACTLNGLLGQITVQATDCSILAIAIVTLIAVTKKTSLSESSRNRDILICASTWVLPCLTGFIALGQHYYSPVSGNWCWITSKPVYLRYVLTHGWRMAFIFIEIVLYCYLHMYLRWHFKNLQAATSTFDLDSRTHNPETESRFKKMISSTKESVVKHQRRNSGSQSVRELTASMVDGAVPPSQVRDLETVEMYDIKPFEIDRRVEVSTSFDRNTHSDRTHQVVTTITSHSRENSTEDITSSSQENGYPDVSINPFAHHRASIIEDEKAVPVRSRKRIQSISRPAKIRKVLLLNAYPAAYIILWIPGILNRLVEASGSSSPTLQVLQASTQFVGLANAITYGWNERIAHQLRKKFSKNSQTPLNFS